MSTYRKLTALQRAERRQNLEAIAADEKAIVVGMVTLIGIDRQPIVHAS